MKNATAITLRKLITKCAVCDGALSGHRFAQLASTVAGDELRPRMTEFLGHAKRHEWNRLADFNDWKGDRNNLVAYVVSGSHPGGLVVVTRDPFELYASEELLVQEVLSADELAAISGLVPVSDWREI